MRLKPSETPYLESHEMISIKKMAVDGGRKNDDRGSLGVNESIDEKCFSNLFWYIENQLLHMAFRLGYDKCLVDVCKENKSTDKEKEFQ